MRRVAFLLAGQGISSGRQRSTGDPSLRLKNGYAQDDAIEERRFPLCLHAGRIDLRYYFECRNSRNTSLYAETSVRQAIHADAAIPPRRRNYRNHSSRNSLSAASKEKSVPIRPAASINANTGLPSLCIQRQFGTDM